ncbi:hypothetical protein EV174_001541 [Coemansia sp. RSA 2320]|nr:hypothetical protein EV174_001541 [Coemansia sp. RSA 2320]
MGAAASPMSIPTDHNTPATAAFGYRRRRDSVISDMVSDCGSSDDEDAGAESDDEYLIPTPASLCANAGSQDEDCLFDMDADRSQRLPMSQPLDPKALTYRHMGKPEPWTVRPMECFNAHQAQVKAIDEDDNEFYL